MAGLSGGRKVSEMDQQVKVLALQPNGSDLLPTTCAYVDEENQIHRVVL